MLFNFGLNDCVLVYQMGKVGSSSIYEGLLREGLSNVYHCHRINPTNIEKVDKAHEAKGNIIKEGRLGLRLHRRIRRNQISLRVITCVRMPVDRNISALFENYGMFSGVSVGAFPEDIASVRKLFLDNYDHDVPLEWFDVELKPVTGIDVYEYEFPHDVGHAVIRSHNTSVLIIKCELPDCEKERVIKSFLNLDSFSIKRRNVGIQKRYGALYKKILSKLRLPDDYVERMCNAKYTKHFYSDIEIGEMRNRWKGLSDDL